jgi:hypothetical protein
MRYARISSLALLILFASTISCATVRQSPLLDERSPRPAIGARGWNFEQTWTADLTGDGNRERIVLLAQVERSGERILWEDAHQWVVYVEEAGGARTYLYSRLVPRGRVDLNVTRPEGASAPRILLIERSGDRVGLWEARYRGRNNVLVDQLALRSVNPTAFVGGTVER